MRRRRRAGAVGDADRRSAEATAPPTATETATPAPAAPPTGTVTSLPTPTSVATPAQTPAATATAGLEPTATPLVTPSGMPATPTGAVTPATTPTIAPTPVATPAEAVCGNGVVEPGEQCDFGDALAGDGCDARCRFEQLVPGGGPRALDCIAEWAVVNPTNQPYLDAGGLPNTRQTCVDGDPQCDGDGITDGACTFRVAACLAVPDPQLPECGAFGGLTRYRLLEPLPSSRDAARAANALALVDAIESFTGTAYDPSTSTFVFQPPLVVPAGGCTQAFDVVVPLDGTASATEHFRIRAFAAPPGGTGNDVADADDLRLVCARR